MYVIFIVANRILIRWLSTVHPVSEIVTMNIKLDAEISLYPRSDMTHLQVRFCSLFAVYD